MEDDEILEPEVPEEPDDTGNPDEPEVPEEPKVAIRDSILLLTKKKLGIAPEYTAFDEDVITDINSAFLTLTQIGVGPKTGFSISDESTLWTEFLGDAKNLEAVKTYIYMRVRLMFDPPTNSFTIESMKNQIAELEWRLNVEVETPLHEEGETNDGE